MNEITKIALTPIHVPFKEQVRKVMGEGSGSLGMAIPAEEAWLGGDFVICRIYDNEGNCGVSEVFVWLPETGVSPQQIIDTISKGLSRYLLGENPFNIEKILHRMNINITRNEVAKGLLDMACYDLMGRILQKPIYELIGGKSVDKIPLAALIPLAAPIMMKAVVKMYRKRGFETFRLKLGNNVQEDLEIVQTIRDVIGPRMRLRVDYNQAYTPSVAVRAIKGIEPFGIDYAEQPVNLDDYAGMAYVQQRVDTPLIMHEGFFSLKDMVTAHQMGAIEAVGINSERPGGISNAIKAINYAHLNGMSIVLHNQPLGIASAMQIHLHTAFYHYIEHPSELFGIEMLEDDLIKRPLEYSDGCVTIPTGPGWGVNLDEDALDKYATSESTIISK